MANTTAWVAGTTLTLTWSATGCPSPVQIAGLAAGSSVFASAPLLNGTNLNQYCDVSGTFTIGSTTLAAGSYIGVYMAILGEDGSTYGDGSFAGGVQTALIPPWAPVARMPQQSTNATTKAAGTEQGIIIPPGSVIFGIYNGLGVGVVSGALQIRNYNINLNR